MLASRWAKRGQVEPKLAEVGPKMGPGIILQDFAVVRRPVLGPSWAILGPHWPFLGGPRGHLEASLGLEGLRWPKMGPRGLPELSWELGSLRGAPFWAHLGPILGYLGPSLALLRGSRRAP